jgi:acetolactate synthase-1/2/3 large subunit
MTSHSTAHYFLEGLVELGIEYLFSNLGTDHVSLIEELARWDRAGRPHPQVILCPHENVAIHMAGGYAAITGRGQAVLVHVDAGTANASMGMHNLFRARVPVFLMAGRAPYTLHGELPGSRDTYVHFVQDPYDIGSLVRPYVKWECSLPSGVMAKEMLTRAYALMQSDPAGPVYLSLPRETLAQQWEESAIRAFAPERYGPVRAGGAGPDSVRRIAAQLLGAKNPIAIASYLGRNPEAVAALDALARVCGIRVFESNPVYLNIARDSPCFAGFDASAAVADADVGLLLDVDVPWVPKYVADNPGACWVHVDIDAIKKDFPMWGFATDLRVQADCATVLGQVLELVRAEADAGFHARAAERIAGWEGMRQERSLRIARAAGSSGKSDAIAPDFLCAALDAALSQDDIVINEAIRNTLPVLNQIMRTRAQTYFGLSGGGLGFSGGMALGLKLARPDRRIVQIVGDGGFHFCTPSSVYAVAQQYGLPVFTVVLDNGGWQAVKDSVMRVYPDGTAAAANAFQSRLEGTHRHFEQIASAFGAYGEAVSEPGQVAGAIERCLDAVGRGRAAVLAVRVTPL